VASVSPSALGPQAEILNNRNAMSISGTSFLRKLGKTLVALRI